MIKRLRIFAGPNGSGKTTIINNIRRETGTNLPLDFFGVYINADDIEREISKNGQLDLNIYRLKCTTGQIQQYFKNSTFSPLKLNNPELWKSFRMAGNMLVIDKPLSLNSYIAADLADFIRQNLLLEGISFTFETVMSDASKIDFIRKAREAAYRVYVYYIATDDPDINISRVNFRVTEHGHYVDPKLIRDRYFRSLKNLKSVVLLTNRAYIFDNSGKASRLIAEVTDGTDVKVFDPEKAPNWFAEYLAG